MAQLMRTSNPVLNQKEFTGYAEIGNRMTVEGTVNKTGLRLKTRVIIDGTRFYTIMVGGPKDFATSKEATAFLDSFEITK